jgi:hypothetical protein
MKDSTESKSLCAYVPMCLSVWHAGISGRLKTSLIRVAFFCLALPSVAWAQLPQVKSVDKPVGAPSEPVALTGFNFGTDITKVTVFFGGAKAVVTSVSDQLL